MGSDPSLVLRMTVDEFRMTVEGFRMRSLSSVFLRPFDLLRINSAEEYLFCRALTCNPNVNQ